MEGHMPKVIIEDAELRERVYYTLASVFQDGEAIARGRRSADGGPWNNRVEEFASKLMKDFLANKHEAISSCLDRLEEELIQEGETIIHQVDAIEAIDDERKRNSNQ